MTKLRFFGIIFTVFFLVWIVSLTFVVSEYESFDDTVFLIVVIAMTILAILMVIDIRNQRQWIRDTAEIEIILDKARVEKFNENRKKKIKDFLIGGTAFMLPLVLIFLVAAIMTSARELIILGLFFIPLYVLIKITQKILKKESDHTQVFILSEVGMIYLKDYVVWGDQWSGSWIDEISTQATRDGGSVLMIQSVSTNRFGDFFKTYHIDLPDHSVSDLDDLVSRIKTTNGRNRYRRRRDKALK